nr:hypothetical protein [Candidatus Sigynarchaeum springense]MDO8119007.1 hypothetical protein [Candidatus Sigynarchaeota archaeon]
MYIESKGAPSATYWVTLAKALEIIGIEVSDQADIDSGLAAEINQPLDTPENRAKILRWWLLFMANAGNRQVDQLRSQVSFREYLAFYADEGIITDKTGDEIKAMTLDELREWLQSKSTGGKNDWVFTRLSEWGFSSGYGSGFGGIR